MTELKNEKEELKKGLKKYKQLLKGNKKSKRCNEQKEN